jgi:hypothetical protein
VYYVRAATRSSGASAKGSPRQAIDYITDGHDLRRDPGAYSDAEIAYIARLDAGWKTELEGGRVPLVGSGTLAGVSDHEELATRFEGACQPWHDRRGTTGYKSFTFTLPKEVSLFAEGHREVAKAAMYAAVGSALDRAFADRDVAAVAAIHTRNDAGEIHYHVHVLVAKFARHRASGRIFSLNSKAGGNTGARVRDIKLAWKDSVDAELQRRLGLRVEQSRPYARPCLVLPDGTRIPPLNRESRRLLDKHLSPSYTATAPDGRRIRKVLQLNDAMDGRIFEVAAGTNGAGWTARAFLEIAPDQARYLGRYEKRVATLKAAGYLTEQGTITPAFRRHFCVRNGIDTPELQRIRLDLASAAARQSVRQRRPVPVPTLWEAVNNYETIRKRAERVGFSPDALKRLDQQAQARRPTRETLHEVRVRAERRALATPGREPPPLPRTRGIIRAFLDVQGARVRSVFLISSGVLSFRYEEHRQLARALRRAAAAELFYARERRLAQVGRCFRPIFWATRVILPKETRRLEVAIARCAGLAAAQTAYTEWRRTFVDEAHRRLRAQAQNLELPEQASLRQAVARARLAIPPHQSDVAVRMLQSGLAVLRQLRPELAQPLVPWDGRESELVAGVLATSRGRTHSLSPDEYRAAVRAGQIGNILERERSLSRPVVPGHLASVAVEIERASVRLRALGLSDPFTREVLESISPREIAQALRELAPARLLAEGPHWTLAAASAREAVRSIAGPLLDNARQQRGGR